MRHALLLSFLLLSGFSFAEQLDPEVEKLVRQEVDRRWKELLDSDAMNQKIEQGIIEFIRKDQKKAGPENLVRIDPAHDHLRGDPEAPLTLLEFSDYECPYCKNFHKTLKKVMPEYPQVNWVYRHFPLAMHDPAASREAEAAECAAELGGNKGFWDFTDAIYSRTHSNGKGFPEDALAPLAEELGMDKTAFQSCLESGKYRQTVEADLKNGEASGVTGTPTSFLIHHATGSVVPVAGNQKKENIEKMLDGVIEKLKLE